MIAGIDVGKRTCHLAVISDDEVVYVGELRYDIPFDYAGIDAPLSMPKQGCFRECERKLHKMGIRVVPPIFLKEISAIGMTIAEKLKVKGVEVFEVYPYATRVILGFAKFDKRKKSGRVEILKALRKFLTVPELKDHNEIDAVISALTVKLFLDGKGELLCGKDGCILIPHPSVKSSVDNRLSYGTCSH